jgi:outer membrane biosynthesis protein TonB
MSQRLQELKLREIQTPEPPVETSERVWRAVEQQIATGGPALELHRGPLIAEVPARAVTLKLVIGGALVLLGVVGGAVGGSRWRAAQEVPIEAERIIEVEAPPSPPSPPIVPTTVVADDAPPEVEAPLPSSVESPKSKPKPEPEPEPPPKPRTLADEVALIQAISKGLKQGEWNSVLKLVAEHERDFADGQFVEERDAAKVRAQCRSGALEPGRKAAERFAARWPSSIHRATIRQDCDL